MTSFSFVLEWYQHVTLAYVKVSLWELSVNCSRTKIARKWSRKRVQLRVHFRKVRTHIVTVGNCSVAHRWILCFNRIRWALSFLLSVNLFMIKKTIGWMPLFHKQSSFANDWPDDICLRNHPEQLSIPFSSVQQRKVCL